MHRTIAAAGPVRTYGAACVIVLALALIILLPGWGVVAGIALLAMGLAMGMGAPALLVLVAVPVRFGIPGPFHSISFFELALPLALVHEVLRHRSAVRVVPANRWSFAASSIFAKRVDGWDWR